ncbi:MAG: hypothetical protein ACPHY8_05775 [Patescibacteria group bacterium]
MNSSCEVTSYLIIQPKLDTKQYHDPDTRIINNPSQEKNHFRPSNFVDVSIPFVEAKNQPHCTIQDFEPSSLIVSISQTLRGARYICVLSLFAVISVIKKLSHVRNFLVRPLSRPH